MEAELHEVDLICNGYKYKIYLNACELKTAKDDPKFLEHLMEKYENLRKHNLVTATAYTENEDCTVLQEIKNNESRNDDNWNEGETKFLIYLFSEHQEDFTNAKQKKHVWTIISEKMISKGFNKSAEKCQRKWLNLNRVYRSIKDKTNKTGRGKIQYKFFDDLDEILGNKPSNSNNTFIVDVGLPSNPEGSTPSTENDPEVIQSTSTNEDSDLDNVEVPRKRKRNYTQEFYKSRMEYFKFKIKGRVLKEERHKERMMVEKERNALLQQILEKLNG